MNDVPAQAAWLLARTTDIPSDDDWLGDRERDALSGLRLPKRRDDWRLGRWVAKRLALGLGMTPTAAAIEVISHDDGWPEFWDDSDLPMSATLSLSHSDGLGLAMVGGVGQVLGCDVEQIAPRPEGFIGDYFTAAEQASVHAATDPDVTTTLIWSAKESALKALRVGLRADTRSVEVDCCADGALTVRQRPAKRVFRGVWMRRHNCVLTFVADPGFATLRELEGE